MFSFSLPELITPVVLGIIPAAIAKNKARSGLCWYIYGLLLLPIAIVHSLCLQGIQSALSVQSTSKSQQRYASTVIAN